MDKYAYLYLSDIRLNVKPKHNLAIDYIKLDELKNTTTAYNAFILDISCRKMLSGIVQNIRGINSYFLTPIFTTFKTDNNFIDGVVSKESDISILLKPLSEKLNMLDLENFHFELKEKILFYMFTRPKKKLSGNLNWKNPYIAEYKLINQFDNTVDSWLEAQNMYRSKLLEKEAFVKKIQACPHCHSGQLSFASRCPNCKSIDIKTEQFIHCYTCGNTEPQEKFEKNATFTCIKCTTVLRQIGQDYDRPLENYTCNNCSDFFIDAEVFAECLICNKLMSTDSLDTRSIYTYKLGHKGIQIARGEAFNCFEGINQFNQVDEQVFKTLLDWMQKNQRRNKSIFFNLIGIRAEKISQLENEHGKVTVTELIDEMVMRIRQQLRETDITTYTRENTLWLLLPYTKSEGSDILVQRIKEILTFKSKQMSVNIITYNSSDESQTDINANTLLKKLTTEIK